MLNDERMRNLLETAYRVIAEIGIRVPEPAYRAAAVASGGRERDGRIVFTRGQIDEYLSRWRERCGYGGTGWPSEPPPQRRRPLRVGVMPYAHTYLDPRTGEHLPLTVDRVEEACRFLSTFAAAGVDVQAIGAPVDVAPALQPILQYKLSAQYIPGGGGCGWYGPPSTAEFIFRMAEALGKPITAIPIYVYSPLQLGGKELDVAVAFADRLKRLHIGNMGSCGATLPALPLPALALSWAETISGAMCVEAITGLPTNWSGGIEPFDLRAQTIPFGAPEQTLYYRLACEASAWMSGSDPSGGSATLLTMAKRPGAQSMLEKGASAAFTVSGGCRYLGAAGSLSADEVFSPVQMVLDLELRDWLERLAGGVDLGGEPGTDDFDVIAAGLRRSEFLTADATLDRYAELTWYPRHLRREMLARWRQLGSPDAVETARLEAIERLERAEWALPEPQFGALEDIWVEACRRLA
jgi:trimethylamine:corrinoid methyltransferase-like protein